MSVVNWDHVESSEAPLSEKQSEAIFLLSTLDSRSPLTPAATQLDDTSVADKNSEPSDSKIGELSDDIAQLEQVLTYFVNIDVAEADVVSPDNSFILLYGRFRSQGPKIRSMISLIEDRIENSSEYVQALLECQKFYLQHREELLAPIVRTGISDLVGKYPNDHCALLRTAGAFMVHTCEDETRLFCQFFNPELSTSLNQMLSTLCRCLYDAFRPLIIHINHVEILSELCDILKYELTDEHVTNSQLDMSAFAELCSMLLADVQERLIFRSHIYIKSQILGYEPSPGDLSYPEKLIMMNVSYSRS
ncbi:hypothetical protein X801_02584 [Opisthorchis viverrini]|uniref:Conserved oligomeric Golgi complex subunit 3 C-terminal domain-containing protein n=1 Tax=Opisthorchis viverrini TaxID=6198 RepID=A0A1S8X482_OPIVI|nr:hypothetical protein X801_02584 [Opisthorchis viverrini]